MLKYQRVVISITGWWLENHFEKYEGQLGRIIPYIMDNKKCSLQP